MNNASSSCLLRCFSDALQAGVVHARAITRIKETTMTKLNVDNSSTTSDNKGAKVRNKRDVPAPARAFPVVLKTLHNDIALANPKLALATDPDATKRMRVKLRANLSDIHARNDAWIFASQAEYDRARCLFDPAYAAQLAAAAASKPKRVRKAAAPVAPAVTADA